MKKNNSPTGFEANLVAASKGARTALGQVAAIVVDGVSYTPAEARKLDGYAALYAVVRSLQAQAHEATVARRKEAPGAREFYRHFKTAVESLLGEQSAELQEFGWTPKKQPARPKRNAAKGSSTPRTP